MTAFLCPRCHSKVRPPGQMGRSFCVKCEDYVLAVESHPVGGDVSGPQRVIEVIEDVRGSYGG